MSKELIVKNLPEYVVKAGLWNDDVRVFEIGRHRHSVLFPGRDEPTDLFFCNNCAGSFTDSDGNCGCGYPRGVAMTCCEKEPFWDKAGKTHDWRNHVPDHVREIWDTFTPKQREALEDWASNLADSELWD